MAKPRVSRKEAEETCKLIINEAIEIYKKYKVRLKDEERVRKELFDSCMKTFEEHYDLY